MARFFFCMWDTYRLNYLRKYSREPPSSYLVVALIGYCIFDLAVGFALDGNFFYITLDGQLFLSELNRVTYDDGTQNPMPPKYLLPSLCLSLLMVIILEVVFRMCDNFLQRHGQIYHSLPSSAADNEDEVDEECETKPMISWPCVLYLFAFGTQCLNKSILVPEVETQIEYLGPMRVTKLPTLHYSTKAHIYDKDDPCLEGTPKRGKYSSFNFQPNIQASVEVGWGYSWGCRSKANSKKWMTSMATIDKCTFFICDIFHASSCPCYPDEESAWNASLECVNNSFNLTLLEQNATFDKEQPPWEDESGWPTLTKYGSCDDDSGYLRIVDIQYFAPREKRLSLYRYFGLFSLIVSLIVAIDKCS
ncbi:hypothetical protein CTEN210_02711 [Chaetoceros tenuissimus]|uniref:Uncharacterized protein n=1 Tax=Chaetoceros tenuissimus TaxID=426638 RepID=A0AAD3CHK7_9STRA|nr:hypothetical protein CTEN210_02711 [Chaetoceros tenuissimus]